MKLSDKVVAAMEPPKGNVAAIVWDDAVRGPGVRCTKDGCRSFVFRYVVRETGRQRQYTIGRARIGNEGEWTAAAARERARDLRRAVDAGGDPMGELRESRAAETMADLWETYKLRVLPQNKPRTVAGKERMWEKRIEPAIGKHKINDVTERDCRAIVDAPLRMREGRIVGGKGEAGNLYRLLHHMFKRGLAWKLRDKALGNPLEDIDEPKVERRQRLLAGGEIGALFRALDTAEADRTEAPQIIAVIRSAMRGGGRISELLTLEDDFIRDDELELHLPDTKSGHSVRPISAETLALLRSVERMPGSPFIFRSIDDPTKPLRYHVVEKAFRRIVKASGIKRCTLHTLRHWFATQTANSVNNPRVGMQLTGHRSLAAYMNYVHADRDQARVLADQLAQLTTALEKAPANVVPLTRRA